MTTKPKHREVAYVPWHPIEGFWIGSVRPLRNIARDDFLVHWGGTWKELYRQGYRIVKVEIREV